MKLGNLIFVFVCVTIACVTDGLAAAISFGAAAINALNFLGME